MLRAWLLCLWWAVQGHPQGCAGSFGRSANPARACHPHRRGWSGRFQNLSQRSQTMADSPFAKLAALAATHSLHAVDERAARVVFYPSDDHSEPPQYASFNGAELPFTAGANTPRKSSEFTPFIGLRRGRLVALQFLSYNRKGRMIFLMRCDCGRYACRRIESWARRTPPDSCSICEKVQALYKASSNSQSRRGVLKARWRNKLLESGLTPQQIDLVDKYKLDASDLQWLKGAIAELEARTVGGV